jgi:hypothetical protein
MMVNRMRREKRTNNKRPNQRSLNQRAKTANPLQDQNLKKNPNARTNETASIDLNLLYSNHSLFIL